PDRASRAARHGPLRPDRRAELRRADRAGRAGEREAQRRRDRSLPGRRSMTDAAAPTARAASTTGVASAPLLALEDLSIHYGRVQALEHVTLEVRAGEVVTLIGANGAGKSTTLRSISRIVPVHRGRIAFDGRDISGARPSDVVRMGIAQVPEGRRMLARQTVLDHLRDPGRRRATGRSLSAPGRAPPAAGGDVVRGRAADARDRARVDEPSAPAPAG